MSNFGTTSKPHPGPVAIQKIRVNMLVGDKKVPVIIELPAEYKVGQILTADWEEIPSSGFKTQ